MFSISTNNICNKYTNLKTSLLSVKYKREKNTLTFPIAIAAIKTIKISFSNIDDVSSYSVVIFMF